MQAPDIHQPETVEVESANIFCDGGGGALGHPKVYLVIAQDKQNFVDCPYCDKRFVLKKDAKTPAHP